MKKPVGAELGSKDETEDNQESNWAEGIVFLVMCDYSKKDLYRNEIDR